jgi:hypothetical protein
VNEQLTTTQVAGLAGVSPASWLVYRRRGTVPPPDGYLGRTPRWHRETIEAWLPTRRKRGPAKVLGRSRVE